MGGTEDIIANGPFQLFSLELTDFLSTTTLPQAYPVNALWNMSHVSTISFPFKLPIWTGSITQGFSVHILRGNLELAPFSPQVRPRFLASLVFGTLIWSGQQCLGERVASVRSTGLFKEQWRRWDISLMKGVCPWQAFSYLACPLQSWILFLCTFLKNLAHLITTYPFWKSNRSWQVTINSFIL